MKLKIFCLNFNNFQPGLVLISIIITFQNHDNFEVMYQHPMYVWEKKKGSITKMSDRCQIVIYHSGQINQDGLVDSLVLISLVCTNRGQGSRSNQISSRSHVTLIDQIHLYCEIQAKKQNILFLKPYSIVH